MVHQASALTRALPLFAAVAVLSVGCMGLRRDKRAEGAPAKAAKAGPPAVQSLATWHKHVKLGTNPASNQPIAGLSGRFYLFDATGGHPIIGDGKISVELFDDTRRDATSGSKMIEKWNIDAETFKQLAQRDALGNGYTLTLPWSTYKPEVAQVHLVVTYEPTTGTPLTTASQTITLEHDSPEAQIARRNAAHSGVVQASAKN